MSSLGVYIACLGILGMLAVAWFDASEDADGWKTWLAFVVSTAVGVSGAAML